MRLEGVRSVSVTGKKLGYDPIMRPLEQVPLLGSDWLARLGHRRIKDTILQGAAQAWRSITSGGTSPYAPLVYKGPDFGKDMDKGHY